MENTRIKYLVMTSIEEELDTLGVYDSKEEAFNAMQSDFCKAVGVDEKNIDEWLDETDDAAICPMDARALDCTTEDGQNHDWRIIPLVCDGECRVAEEHDYLVVSGIYNTECDSVLEMLIRQYNTDGSKMDPKQIFDRIEKIHGEPIYWV